MEKAAGQPPPPRRRATNPTAIGLSELEEEAAIDSALDVLRLSHGATAAEIHSAFASEIRSAHPDKGGDPTGCADRIAQLQEARDTLRLAAGAGWPVLAATLEQGRFSPKSALSARAKKQRRSQCPKQGQKCEL